VTAVQFLFLYNRQNMDLEEATIDDIILELKTRTQKFVLIAVEEPNTKRDIRAWVFGKGSKITLMRMLHMGIKEIKQRP
jgi:hypothetical protein